MNKGAAFSDCRKYRYALWRIWDETKPCVMFVGLNPSTANEYTDDNTIKRVQMIARNLEYGGIYMCNSFPYISTDPKQLTQFGNTAINDFWLYQCEKKCAAVIFAWGNFKIVSDTGRDKELASMFTNALALRINKNGSPQHPLYIPANVVPVKFKQ